MVCDEAKAYLKQEAKQKRNAEKLNAMIKIKSFHLPRLAINPENAICILNKLYLNTKLDESTQRQFAEISLKVAMHILNTKELCTVDCVTHIFHVYPQILKKQPSLLRRLSENSPSGAERAKEIEKWIEIRAKLHQVIFNEAEWSCKPQTSIANRIYTAVSTFVAFQR